MNHWIRQPVTFNIITVLSLVAITIATFTAGAGRVYDDAKAEALLEQLAAESEAVDEIMVAFVKETRVSRRQHVNNIILMVFVAVLASFAANYFGRRRHHDNVARIRELQAQLGGIS